MSDLVLKRFAELTTTELYGILQARSQVFVVEQDCVFLDLDGVDTLEGTRMRSSRDRGGRWPIRTVRSSGRASCRSPTRGCSHPTSPTVRRRNPGRGIGRVVTDPAVRGGGWGRRLVADLVEAFPGEPLTLNAQSHLERFYSGFGFSPNGPRFDEDGIEHTPMSRPASALVGDAAGTL